MNCCDKEATNAPSSNHPSIHFLQCPYRIAPPRYIRWRSVISRVWPRFSRIIVHLHPSHKPATAVRWWFIRRRSEQYAHQSFIPMYIIITPAPACWQWQAAYPRARGFWSEAVASSKTSSSLNSEFIQKGPRKIIFDEPYPAAYVIKLIKIRICLTKAPHQKTIQHPLVNATCPPRMWPPIHPSIRI